jgi:hypothetical protein
MERIVKTRLVRHANKERIIRNEQFGFRKKHSTTMQLARLTNNITRGYNMRKHTGLVLLDIEKAFDTVWAKGLLYKLIKYQFPTYLIQFLKSYLSDRTFSVTIDGFSSLMSNTYGRAPQEAVLSPILFTLYTSDFPKTPFVQTAMYADVTALFSQSWRPATIARRLSYAITRLTSYFTLWRLKGNMDKTEAILFIKRRPVQPHPTPSGKRK